MLITTTITAITTTALSIYQWMCYSEQQKKKHNVGLVYSAGAEVEVREVLRIELIISLRN